VIPGPRASIPAEILHAPVLAIGRGGSGTRLTSELLQQLGVFMGNRLNASGDSVEWVDLIYEMAVTIVPARPRRFPGEWREALLDLAARVLSGGGWSSGGRWGFKLPETVLVLPELLAAFPLATVIHLVRDPLDTCLRRTHVTSRMDNPVGRVTLAAAYRALGWQSDPARDDDHLRNAASWRYQLELVSQALRDFAHVPQVQVRYEDLCDDPERAAETCARALGVGARRVTLTIDGARRRLWADGDPRADVVWRICGDVAGRLGYRPATRRG
jgi:hypothetical protein